MPATTQNASDGACNLQSSQCNRQRDNIYLVAGNVADVRCLVSQRLTAAGVLVGLVLGLLSLYDINPMSGGDENC